MDLVGPVDHRVKIKVNEKRDRYWDLARELKTLCNMKMTVIQITVGALGTVPKVLVRGLKRLGIEGRTKTIQNIALLRKAKY